MKSVNQAVILAAGQGSRLNGANNGAAKCMSEVGGTTLIEHQIHTLRSVGIERIIVVIGHEAEAVKACAGEDCIYIENTRYAETNSLYSLWLAKKAVTGAFLLMNGDVLAHPEVYCRLIEADGTALAFDSTSGDKDEHMKVHVFDGKLRAISKELPQSETRGENVGILRFDHDDVPALFDAVDTFIEQGEHSMWSPAAVGKLSQTRPVQCIDVSDLAWVEIDFPEDLELARNEIWQKVCSTSIQRTHRNGTNRIQSCRTSSRRNGAVPFVNRVNDRSNNKCINKLD